MVPASPENPPVRVKFVAKGNTLDYAPVWRRQLPGAGDRWGRCLFSFDPDERDYDWLVVYDDLPPVGGERFSERVEALACPPSNTLFITAEPSSIKVYGRDFLAQFGWVLTSQEPWATPHPHAIHSQPGLRWFYGVPWHWREHPEGLRSWDEMRAMVPSEKSRLISTVTSSKQMAWTQHRARFDFIGRLGEAMPELDVYGHGVRLIEDKADALDPYRYHLAIENHVCEHHFTEKLTDTFLGCALPFYSGCPNAADYFPEDSFIAIDIGDIEGSLARIRRAIADNEYQKRLPAILEARRRVLEEYNLFAVIDRIVRQHHDPAAAVMPGARLASRRRAQTANPLRMLRFLLEKRRIRRRNRAP